MKLQLSTLDVNCQSEEYSENHSLLRNLEVSIRRALSIVRYQSDRTPPVFHSTQILHRKSIRALHTCNRAKLVL